MSYISRPENKSPMDLIRFYRVLIFTPFTLSYGSVCRKYSTMSTRLPTQIYQTSVKSARAVKVGFEQFLAPQNGGVRTDREERTSNTRNSVIVRPSEETSSMDRPCHRDQVKCTRWARQDELHRCDHIVNTLRGQRWAGRCTADSIGQDGVRGTLCLLFFSFFFG
jgi:hypothetical protein